MPDTRAHTATVELECSAARAFTAIISPSEIRHWWGADRVVVNPIPGGVWAAAWGDEEDNPDYLSAAIMSAFQPPNRIVFTSQQYRALEGDLPFEANFTTTWAIMPTDNGCTLTVTQDGFPTDQAADPFFEGCKKGWHDTLDAFKNYVESDPPA